MANTKECYCGKPAPERSQCEVLTVTPSERMAMGGVSAPSEILVCKPCWEMLKGPQGREYTKNRLARTLNALGVPKAESKASNYLDLVDAKKKVPHK